MATSPPLPQAFLEIQEPSGTKRIVPITQSPSRLGRGTEADNHILLQEREVSRRCAAVTYRNGTFFLEDLGQREGLYVNGKKLDTPQGLGDGDVITFGKFEALRVIFHTDRVRDSIPELLSRFDQPSGPEAGDRNLHHLSLLLEATALLQSRMSLEQVLGAIVDRAIVVTEADRGLLFQAGPGDALRPLAARGRGQVSLPLDSISPSKTAIAQALKQRRSIITQDLALAEEALRKAQSIIAQQLRSVMVVPLSSLADVHATGVTSVSTSGELLGLLYLDSRRPAAFSGLQRQILDALAVQAASIIEKARLLEREQDRRRLEQELNMARDIQQSLLPKDFKQFSYLQVTGVNHPCYEVGGDYFDLIELGRDRVAFVIADVSGKGLGAALLTAVLQGSFAGMTLTPEPTKLFNHVNRFINTRAQSNRYATLFFGNLDAAGHLDFINAGHYSPLLVRGSTISQPFPSECLPLGLLPDSVFTVRSSRLEPGDTVVFFTDGVNEAVNIEEEEFGVERLQEVVAANGRGTLEALQAAILAALDDFTRGANQADDITLLILRYIGPPESSPEALAGTEGGSSDSLR